MSEESIEVLQGPLGSRNLIAENAQLRRELEEAKRQLLERDTFLSEDVAPFAQEVDGLKWYETLEDGTEIPVLRGSPNLVAFIVKLHNSAAELEMQLAEAQRKVESLDLAVFTLEDMNKTLRASHEALCVALEEAKQTIRALHGEPVWDIYDRSSPEMKRLNSAIAAAAPLRKSRTTK